MPAFFRSSGDPAARIRTRHLYRPKAILSSLERTFMPLICLLLVLSAIACHSESGQERLRPRQLRDVSSRALAFNFQADVEPPPAATADDAKIIPATQDDFDKRHPDFALLRTVVSPDNQRALALYNTADEPSQTFRIDLYSADGSFLRDVTPPELAVVFQDSVAWSADSSFIAFVGRRSVQAQPSPTPIEPFMPAVPSASPELP